MSTEERTISLTEATTDRTSERSIDEKTVGDVFEHTRRRIVVNYLRSCESAVELDELAGQVAAREFDTAREDVPSDRYERVLVSLYHTHLPKLADAGIVTIERNDGVHVTRNDGVFEALA